VHILLRLKLDNILLEPMQTNSNFDWKWKGHIIIIIYTQNKFRLTTVKRVNGRLCVCCSVRLWVFRSSNKQNSQSVWNSLYTGKPKQRISKDRLRKNFDRDDWWLRNERAGPGVEHVYIIISCRKWTKRMRV